MPGSSQGPGSSDAVEVIGADDPEWHRFVSGAPQATCFHRPAWMTTLSRTYGFRCLVTVQRDEAGSVVAGLPVMEVRRPGGRRRWVSLPFSDECAPLCPEDSTARFLEQVDARRRAEGVADLEVRTWVDPAVAPSQQVAVTHELDLHVPFTTSGLPARARASVRHDVAAAHRRGLRVTAARTVEDVVDTYYRLHLRTRRRHGVPAQPRKYFRSLWENVLEPGDGLVLIARAGDTPVAGAVLLVGGSVATYKYSASDPYAWSLHPNHAVLSAAITWARERGCATFDFGRTDADNPGLRKFKESWGAQTRPLYYTSFGGRVGYRAGGPAHSLLASVIRRSPPAVCRGLGRLLYRYAA